MARKAFFSFHYIPDCYRAAQIRNMGALEGNAPVSDNDWEKVKKSEETIKKWIAEQLHGRSCTVVLVGKETSGRKWITHEIIESWNTGMGIVGVHIHNLKDLQAAQSGKGSNPFDHVTIGDKKLSTIVKLYDPPYSISTNVHKHIKDNLSDWVEEAITIRKKH